MMYVYIYTHIYIYIYIYIDNMLNGTSDIENIRCSNACTWTSTFDFTTQLRGCFLVKPKRLRGFSKVCVFH